MTKVINTLKTFGIMTNITMLIIGIKQSDLLIFIVGVLGVSFAVFQLYYEVKKDKISDLKERANNIAGHFRSVRGNYFNSDLESTSTFLQVLVRELSLEDLKKLIEANYFNMDEKKQIKKYLESEPS